MYFSYTYTYITYANLAWASTNGPNLKKIDSQQKHAARITHNENRYTHARPLMKLSNILNVYQINILNTLNFMYRVKTKTSSLDILSRFHIASHPYPTNLLRINFVKPLSKLTIKIQNFCERSYHLVSFSV